ncbi:MAG: TonB-dependent receptor [Muribaculaceae bacterium]|nr:TonB-dependent receptor [Muribaculaceae bacterium]
MALPFAVMAQNVTIHPNAQPAAGFFREIMGQTGKNFVYSSDLLKDLVITVDANRKPLKKVLSDMFDGTDIEYKINGSNVVLKRKQRKVTTKVSGTKPVVYKAKSPDEKTALLSELVVVSRLEAPAVETSEIGAKKVTADEVRRMPVMFGESDVIKTLQSQPGVSEGTEGLAGMYVHGGNSDENQYMLDNVPLYQVNHFAGLFSAFNPEIIRYVDFFKSSIPAKYDGRLSSFMDVRLQNSVPEKIHGTARLGLTSGAFNITGPIGNNTSYLVGLRRSWYDVLTIPMLAIINSKNEDEKVRLQYYFMDLNARINHRFSDNLSAFVSAYYGNDLLKSGDEFTDSYGYENDKYDFKWGNFVVQGGVNYRFNPTLTSEFTVAYTRFISSIKRSEYVKEENEGSTTESHSKLTTDNNVNDWIFKGDFDWTPNDDSRVRFGANYVRHSFLPTRTTRDMRFNDNRVVTRDSVQAYGANEANLYIEDDWKISDNLRVNGGLHYSIFHIDQKFHNNVSPRLSLAWRPDECIAVKGAYSRTVQYVHQLAQSDLSLPTDQWIPITGKFKPQTADKISFGVYGQTADGRFSASAEGYWKWMHNMVEYRDEYYLAPPLEMWNARLTSGRGVAKGIDFKIEKRTGKLTGHIAYSLGWSDRTFAEKNGGVTYPARFDNRHTINIVANWDVSKKVQLNAAWVGHSGNRFTFMPQFWSPDDFGRLDFNYGEDAPLHCPVNNYQLPFYHRLDLSCTVKNKRGYWTFSLYNAYCHMNTIAIRYGSKDVKEQTSYGTTIVSKPVFQKVKILPIIPSITYTWQF